MARKSLSIYRTIWLAWKAHRGYRILLKEDDEVGWMTVLGQGEPLARFVEGMKEQGWHEVNS